MVIAALTPACSCAADSMVDEPPTASGFWGTGGHGAAVSSGGVGDGGGGGAQAGTRAGASETVSAGEVAKSSRYRMVFTLGQPTQNQEKTTSPGYRMQGGLVGANASSP
ncbi:hypothetical protein [Sorangium sp. So ce388]|uniref:hypothetical protein n=1 Tax=Sorangium sp. So ce388 TaxID=3133309 RepID=UPI003F5C5F8B